MPVEYLEHEGGKLVVEFRGPASAPLVVCSPALGDTRDAYYPLADQLAGAGYRVLITDLRGHGDSSTGFASYGDEAIARDYIKLVETYSPNKQPAVLAGASMSAAGAAIAAGRRPDLVAGLIVMGPFLRNPSGAAVVRPLLMASLIKPWGPTIWKSYAAGLWPGLGAEGTSKRAASTTALLNRPGGYWSAFRATVAGADHSKVTPWLPKIKHQPALVVVGDKDPDWSKPVEEADWVAAQFTDATKVIVPDVGHAPYHENPAMVGPEVIKFLAKLRAGDAFKPSSGRA